MLGAVNSGQPDTPGRSRGHRSGRHRFGWDRVGWDQRDAPKGFGEDIERVEHLLEATSRLLITSLQAMRCADPAGRRNVRMAISELTQIGQGVLQTRQSLLSVVLPGPVA